MRSSMSALVILCAVSTGLAAPVEKHVVETEYQNGKQEIRVLLPDDYATNDSYRVLYVLPVEEGFGSRYGDGLAILEEMNAHNEHGLIIVQMGFEKEPWFGDHATDPKVRQASYMTEFVVPFIEKKYRTLGAPEGRMLLGFSKSGWGAFSLILKDPEFFGYAAAWDAPLMLDGFSWGMESVYGTRERLREFQFDQLVPKQSAHFRDRPRLVLTGERFWGTMKKTPTDRASHTVEAHLLLEAAGIKHHYDNSLNVEHRWHRAWMEPTLKALMSLTKTEKSETAEPAAAAGRGESSR